MRQLEDHQALQKGDFVFGDADQFRYELHSLPDDATERLGTYTSEFKPTIKRFGIKGYGFKVVTFRVWIVQTSQE